MARRLHNEWLASWIVLEESEDEWEFAEFAEVGSQTLQGWMHDGRNDVWHLVYGTV